MTDSYWTITIVEHNNYDQVTMGTTQLTLYNMLFLFFFLFLFFSMSHTTNSHLYLDGILIILPLLVRLTTVSSLVVSSGTDYWDISWGSTTDCWDIGWDFGADYWDFDLCSAKLFRDFMNNFIIILRRYCFLFLCKRWVSVF